MDRDALGCKMPLVTAIHANGIEIEYESFGDGEPLVLIMGIGCQMLLWPEKFCRRLAARGFRVIRFDNRDVGLSTWFDHEPPPDMLRVVMRAYLGLPSEAPYTLADMSDDVVGLLDGLAIDRAHIVGASMGGMIAQEMALRSSFRMHSMVSIMSHTGNRRYWRARPRAAAALMKKIPRERQAFVDNTVSFFRTVSGPGFPFDSERIAETAGQAFDRGYHPAGFKRQNAAVFASGGRLKRLQKVQVPTLVIHGTHDPLIVPAGGKATARAIPGAKLEMIEGMGHNMPEAAWPILIDAIAQHAHSAIRH